MKLNKLILLSVIASVVILGACTQQQIDTIEDTTEKADELLIDTQEKADEFEEMSEEIQEENQ